MTERKLASIRKIEALEPIEGADLIEVAIVDGWSVVVKKGEFVEGMLAIYLEIDSWVPHSIAPFLTKPGQFPKTYAGIEGQKLKTIKLRGQISQGLLLKIGDFHYELTKAGIPFVDGEDVTEALGIIKWEPPVTGNTGGISAGSFPSHLVPKTDAERVQNLKRKIDEMRLLSAEYFATEKLDGTSFTAAHDGTETIVCSRNLKLKDEGDGVYWKMAHENRIPEFLEKNAEDGKLYAIQGEILGPGIQGNKYKLNKPTLYVFNIWDVKEREYLHYTHMLRICVDNGWESAPLITFFDDRFTVDIGYDEGFVSVKAILESAEGKSLLNPKTEREGIVFWPFGGSGLKFKAISNKWLMKCGE